MKQLPISRIRAIDQMHPDTLVRIYSYQGQDAWDIAKERGHWTGDESIHAEDGEYGWNYAYRWMREKMAERIPDFSGDFPMWGWLKRPSSKPKLSRFCSTQSIIRITALIPRRRILMSDYHNWHSVLNMNMNCKTDEEWDIFATEWSGHWSDYSLEKLQQYLSIIRPSWDGILSFDPTYNPTKLEHRGSVKRFTVQACIDRIRWDEIVDVRRFG